MTDLEQLKQQLHAKIQAISKPEQPPSDVEMLKYSQLPEYQAHQKLRQQTEQRWQQAPMQGAVAQPTDWERQALTDDLTTAQQFLQAAYDAAVKLGLNKTHYELNGAIADALNACNEAMQRLDDAPDI